MPGGGVRSRLQKELAKRAAEAKAAAEATSVLMPGVEINGTSFHQVRGEDGQVVVSCTIDTRKFPGGRTKTKEQMVLELGQDQTMVKKFQTEKTKFHAEVIDDTWKQYMEVLKYKKEEQQKKQQKKQQKQQQKQQKQQKQQEGFDALDEAIGAYAKMKKAALKHFISRHFMTWKEVCGFKFIDPFKALSVDEK